MGNSLSGKVAFVTGAAAKRGMGRAVAIRLAQEGADVMVTDKFAAPKSAWIGDENWKGLEDVVKEIEALGRKAIYAVAGVEDSKEVEAAVRATIKKFGQIDILVHCAGTRGPVGVNIADGDEKDWKLLFDVNSLGTMIVSKYVADPTNQFFAIPTAGPTRDYAILAVGSSATFPNNLTGFAQFTAALGLDNETNYGVVVGLRKQF